VCLTFEIAKAPLEHTDLILYRIARHAVLSVAKLPNDTLMQLLVELLYFLM
jgi:hypothetical protein